MLSSNSVLNQALRCAHETQRIIYVEQLGVPALVTHLVVQNLVRFAPVLMVIAVRIFLFP